MIIVSACLLGYCCRYTGGHSKNEAVLAYLAGRDYLSVCPEELAGLPTPRPAAEIVDGSGEEVLDNSGCDVTALFLAGAEAVVDLARRHGAGTAILKERSPSCGVREIYDGSFSGAKKAGRGVCAALLKQAGITVFSEEKMP